MKYIIQLIFMLCLSGCFYTECENYQVANFIAQNGRYNIEAYSRDCGATTSFSPQVRAWIPGSNYDEIIFVLKRAPDPTFEINWAADQYIELKFNFAFEKADIVKAITTHDFGIKVFQNNKLIFQYDPIKS